MPYPYQPWRDSLLPASFGGAEFHVEVGSQSGGRRIAGHEYPKSETPYAEDMGRKAGGWQITAYLIGPFYLGARDALLAVCDSEGPYTLVHPTFGAKQVHCGPYTASESRERGGYAQVDMTFFEAGQNPDASGTADTASQAASASSASNDASASTADAGLAGQTGGGVGGISAGAGSGDYVPTPGGPTGGYPGGINPPTLSTGPTGFVVGGA